jgi:hypothetical protein
LRFTTNYIFIFFIFIFSFNCGKKNITPLNYSGKIIEFTNGGGFTGAFSSIFLQEDGKLYRNGMSDTSFIHIGHLDKTTVKQVFNNYEKLGLNKIQLNEPGNRYFYITMKSNGKSHKIQWGRNTLTNTNPSIFFSNMMYIVKKMEDANSIK